MKPRLGLVLSGGGARAAYQAGALRALAEIAPGPAPFEVLAGCSAGAINTAFLAARAEDFRAGAARLCDIWTALTPEKVFRADPLTLGRTGLRWAASLTLGGFVAPPSIANYLLDTTPLRKLVAELVDFAAIEGTLRAGALRGIAISATSYQTGTAVSFFDGHPEIEPWARSARIGRRSVVGIDHVLASASIPIFFRPVRVGDAFFGDGCLRLSAPLSPAIHLGADRIIAVGVRYPRASGETVALNELQLPKDPALAEIAGILLNAVFLDALEGDAERMDRINRTVALVPEARRGEIPSRLRHVPFLHLRPSQDLGKLAADHFDSFPKTIRHLLRGFGASGRRATDFLSYLTFDGSYTRPLVDLGYRDTLARRAEIEALLRG